MLLAVLPMRDGLGGDRRDRVRTWLLLAVSLSSFFCLGAFLYECLSLDLYLIAFGGFSTHLALCLKMVVCMVMFLYVFRPN